MKTKMRSTMAIVAMMWGAGAAPHSLAQTPNETPMEHARPGHQMNRPSDGAFHHRFEDADYALVDTLELLPRQYCLIFDTGSS